MILSERLLDMCLKFNYDSLQVSDKEFSKQVNQLNRDICKECEANYKSELIRKFCLQNPQTIIDETFNQFDLFVIKAIESDDYRLNAMGRLFQKHTYRKQFMSNPELERLYNKLLEK
jgi:hypothetical protein